MFLVFSSHSAFSLHFCLQTCSREGGVRHKEKKVKERIRAKWERRARAQGGQQLQQGSLEMAHASELRALCTGVSAHTFNFVLETNESLCTSRLMVANSRS